MEKTKKQSISGRLIGIVSLIMAAALLLLTVVSAASIYSLSVAENESGLRLNTQALSNEIDGWIAEVKKSVEHNAIAGEQFFEDFKVKDAVVKSYWEYLSRIYKKAGGEYSEVYAGFTDGTAVTGSGWIPPADLDVRTRVWYTAPMATPGTVVVTEPYYDVAGQTVALSFAATIGNGTDKGCAVIDVSLSVAEKMVSDANSKGDDSGMDSFVVGTSGDVYITEDEDLKPDG